jgi:hypothetical protein
MDRYPPGDPLRGSRHRQHEDHDHQAHPPERHPSSPANRRAHTRATCPSRASPVQAIQRQEGLRTRTPDREIRGHPAGDLKDLGATQSSSRIDQGVREAASLRKSPANPQPKPNAVRKASAIPSLGCQPFMARPSTNHRQRHLHQGDGYPAAARRHEHRCDHQAPRRAAASDRPGCRSASASPSAGGHRSAAPTTSPAPHGQIRFRYCAALARYGNEPNMPSERHLLQVDHPQQILRPVQPMQDAHQAP